MRSSEYSSDSASQPDHSKENKLSGGLERVDSSGTFEVPTRDLDFASRPQFGTSSETNSRTLADKKAKRPRTPKSRPEAVYERVVGEGLQRSVNDFNSYFKTVTDEECLMIVQHAVTKPPKHGTRLTDLQQKLNVAEPEDWMGVMRIIAHHAAEKAVVDREWDQMEQRLANK
jgi:hypothetical protein